MKKCQLCGKAASMQLTQILNGEVTELTLCEACAKQRGLYDPKSLSFAEKFFPEQIKDKVDEIVRELGRSTEAQATAKQSGTQCDMLTRCPNCNFTLEDYRRTERLGCSDCYEVFARELDLVKSIAPELDEAALLDEQSASPHELIKRAEKQLKEAIHCEDYEKAAALRDEISRLKSL